MNNTQTNPHKTNYSGKLLTELADNYCVIDIETTGLSPAKNEIIELCALKVRNNVLTDSFTTLVKPNSYINSFISKLTGITNEMTKTAPTIDEILIKYLEFIGNDIVMGHNVTFDINFINDKSLKCYNKNFANNYIDTCTMARKICPIKRHKLDYVAQYYNIDASGHHRAKHDCIMTFKIYNAMKNEILCQNF